MSYDRWREEPYISMKGTDRCWPECPLYIDAVPLKNNENAECICAQLDEEAKEAMRSEY